MALGFNPAGIGTALNPYATTCPKGYRPEMRDGKLVCVPASSPVGGGFQFDQQWLIWGGIALGAMLLLRRR